MIKSLVKKISLIRWNKNLIRKINKVLHNNKLLRGKKLSLSEKIETKNYWYQYNYKINLHWHTAYSEISSRKDVRYVPENIFYINLLPKLGNLALSKAYADKNMYDLLFKTFNKPTTILKNIHGRFYDQTYNEINKNNVCKLLTKTDGKYIIKPSLDTSQGRSVQKLTIKNGTLILNNLEINFDTIEKEYQRNYLIQEVVEQLEVFNKIYPHSLNTIRMITFRHKGEIIHLSSVLRTGNQGLAVDNYTLGGIAIGISEDGTLNAFGMDNRFYKYNKHPYTGYQFDNVVIKNFNDGINLAKQMHQNLLYFNMVSWDIAINSEGEFVFIEVNLGGQEINFHQGNNGPLFGAFTDEIMSDLQKNN